MFVWKITAQNRKKKGNETRNGKKTAEAAKATVEVFMEKIEK